MSNVIPEIFDTWGNLARQQGLIVVPQGTIADSGTGIATFGSKLFVMNPYTGSFIEVLAGAYTLADKECLICDIPPTAAVGSIVTPTVVSWTNDNRKWVQRDKLVLAQRIGNKIFFNFDVPINAFVPPDLTVDLRTTIPVSPVNGQEIAYTDSVTTPTFIWQLRYISTTGKWQPQAGSWGHLTSLPTVPANVQNVSVTLTDSLSSPTYEWDLIWNEASAKWRCKGGWGLGTSLPTVPASCDRVPFTHTDDLTTPTHEWHLIRDTANSKWRTVGGWGLNVFFPTVPSGVDRVPFTLTDSVTSPSWHWDFIYNNDVATYKWEFIGGSDAAVAVYTSESTASTTYGNLGTLGPYFVVPVAGFYNVKFRCMANDVAPGEYAIASVGVIGGAGVSLVNDIWAIQLYNDSAAGGTGLYVSLEGFMENLLTLAGGSDYISMQYRSGFGQTVSFQYRKMWITPVKLSV